MLELRDIVKDYPAGDGIVHALRGVSLSFRKSEFVSVLGQSGCGKTTMLNIIGGLDKYTSGDLIIGGRSTKDFRDRDWDAYRNHSVGFVFQSYNLISHQTVLANVELALSLSGVKKAERRRRATEALKRVGLGDQLKKKPSEMSGGQMQRVAIARAIVNKPRHHPRRRTDRRAGQRNLSSGNGNPPGNLPRPARHHGHAQPRAR